VRLSQLQQAFEIELQDDLNEYLGIKTDSYANVNVHVSQPQIIDSILVDLKLLNENGNVLNNTQTKYVPSMSTRKIRADPNVMLFNQPWHY
jgi:hypothetical protein